MKYISSTKGSLIALVLFSIFYIFLPIPVIQLPGVEAILTISTFLFAIIAGFFMSRLNDRYNDMRSLVSEEDALFLALFKTSQFFGTGFSKKITELIDQYYVRAYDVPLAAYVYVQNADVYLCMWDETRKLKKKEPEAVFQVLVQQLQDIEKLRNSSSELSRERVEMGQWATLIVLTIIILVSLSIMRTEGFASLVISILFSTSLALILLIMRDLQNLMHGGKQLVEESGQEVLEMIGKKHYYNSQLVDRGISVIPKGLKEYRLGMHEPGAEKKIIKIVKKKT